MKWTKKTKCIVIIILASLLLVCIFVIIFELTNQNNPIERFEQAGPKSGSIQTQLPAPSDTEPNLMDLPQVTSEPEPYQSPVDFDMLQESNPDIYAWLEIPDTDISYPLLQNSENDAYYLSHDAERKENQGGALFTEATYNDLFFNDPVTVVYGHHMRNGLMFGQLQELYSGSDSVEKHREIVIYLPERELHFEVFAAVPYGNCHILHNYDFSDRRTFRLFFDGILSVRAIEAVFSEDTLVQSGDQVLILSTCLVGNRTNRFLVCAKYSNQE
ncbi:MAG: class B sortase [Oscillospiraceae bacterium]|nr:class B sortase [Oscillospiraceae bacterium]